MLEGGGSLIFRLAGDVLDRESVAFLGMVFLSVLSNVVLQRAGVSLESRRRVHVYLDEYGRFATKTTERMLEEFGKYQFGITVAHQNLIQLPSQRAPSAASLILFQLDGDDAQELSLQLDCSPRRTKQVLRQRTAPQYKKWTEEVWDSGANKTYYEELQAREEQLRSDMRTVQALLDYLYSQEACEYVKYSHPDVQMEILYSNWPFLRGSNLNTPERISQVLQDVKRLEQQNYWLQRIIDTLRKKWEFLRADEIFYARYAYEAGRFLDDLKKAERSIANWRPPPPDRPQKIRELKSKREQLQQELAAVSLVSREFYTTHHSYQHRQEYIGDLPEKHITYSMQSGLQGRYPTTRSVAQSDQWYDYVEELDQTHADRRAEITTELATLPKFVAYCKLLDASGTPHEYRVQTNSSLRGPSNVGAINVVRSRSLERHGTPKETIEAQIKDRQRRRAGSPPDDEPPVIGRRSPKQ